MNGNKKSMIKRLMALAVALSMMMTGLGDAMPGLFSALADTEPVAAEANAPNR